MIALFSLLSTSFALDVGDSAPAFSLSTADNVTHSLEQYSGKIVVLEWFNPGCPFVKYVHKEGLMKKTADLVIKDNKEVVWLAINSSAPGKQGADVKENQKSADNWGISYPILFDSNGAIGKAYGAKTTPQIFVIDGAGKVVYKGAYDNAPRGKTQSNQTYQNYVEQSVAELSSGKAVSVAQTAPYGCSVKY